MKNNQQWTDFAQKLPTLISGGISLTTTIIGFVLLIKGNYQLGISILGLLTLIVLFSTCIYFAFTKTLPLVEGGTGVYRFKKMRLLAFLGIAAIVVSMFLILARESNRTFLLAGFRNSPSIEKIIIGESSVDHKIQITTFNPLSMDIGIENNKILFKTDVFTNSDDFKGYSLTAEGYFTKNDCQTGFGVEFETAFILIKNSFTSFYITIPNEFQVSGASEWGSHGPQPMLYPDLTKINLWSDPEPETSNLELEMIYNDSKSMNYILKLK